MINSTKINSYVDAVFLGKGEVEVSITSGSTILRAMCFA